VSPGAAPPVVSVVVTCYNLGRYLAEAVDSVRAQTWRAVELVVVDDGSTEADTRSALDALERTGVRVLRQANAGPAAARNRGIRETSGPYLCCLDADDRLRPAYFEKAVAAMGSHADVGLVTTWYETFGGKQETVRPERCELPRVLAQNQAMSAAMFRRDAWARAGGYCVALPLAHDWDLWISILEGGYRAVMIPEVLFEYRVRPGSLFSRTRRPEHFGPLMRQLAERHRASYERYLPEVVAVMGEEWAAAVEACTTLLDAFQRQEERTAWLEADNARLRGLLGTRLHRLAGRMEGWLGRVVRRRRPTGEATRSRDAARVSGAGGDATTAGAAGPPQGGTV
jgi:glycosyltransferase involved in cell wall biosynthesis